MAPRTAARELAHERTRRVGTAPGRTGEARAPARRESRAYPPVHPNPGGADDLASSVAWVKNNIAQYGGNGEKIFVIGHSAGGTHVATYAYDPAPGYLGRDVAGIVLISARLAADVLPENPNAAGVRAYFGTDESVYEKRSPLNHITALNPATKMPVFTVNAEYENPLLDLYGLEFAHRIAVIRRHAPRFMRLPHHNHISIVAHFNSGEEALGREMIEFFESGR